MGKLAVVSFAALLALSSSPAFAEDDATFREFEASCRLGDNIDPGCELAVFGAYAYLLNVKGVGCDWAKFWTVSDASIDADRAAEPWQVGVGIVVQEPGVCHAVP